MRNILLENLKLFNLTCGDISNIEAYIVNEFGSIVYAISYKKTLYTIQFTKDWQSIIQVDSKDLSSEILEQQQILKVHLLRYNNSIIIILKDGFIFKFDILEEKLEEIGEQEEGFHTAELSPNEEYLVVATGTGVNSLALFNKDFELQDEKPIIEDPNDTEFYNRKLLSVKIVWRYDSEFFNIQVKTEEGCKCITKDKNLNTFLSPAKSDEEEDGLVQSMTEKWRSSVVGSCLTWMPNGSLIMSNDEKVLKNGKKESRIIMFEKNSLRHGQFNLPYIGKNIDENSTESNLQVLDLSWNKSTQMQAILCKVNIENVTENKQVVLLYMRNNYKWYLKKVISITSDKVSLMRFCQKSQWDLYICQEQTGFSIQSFSFNLIKGPYSTKDVQTGQEIQHDALCCSVDYNKLYMTPYHKLQVPPPMSHFEIELESFPMSVSISKNSIVQIESDGRLVIYDYTFSDSVTRYATKESILGDNVDSTQILKLMAVRRTDSEFTLAFVQTSFKADSLLNQKTLMIREVEINTETKEISLDKKSNFDLIEEEMNPPSLGVGQFDASNLNSIKLIFLNGKNILFLYHDNTIKCLRDGEICLYGSLNSDLDVIDLICYSDVSHSNKKKVSMVLDENEDMNYMSDSEDHQDSGTELNYFGITKDDKLLHNGTVIINDCTSYTVYNEKFLLFTTLNQGMYDLLHTYTLEEVRKGNVNLIASQLPKSTDGKSHYIRNIERGSRIIVCADDRLIFQLPRGNLEAINPRLLMIHKVKSSLCKKDYGKLYVYLRKNKLDMNLIFDIFPEQVVADIKNGSFLCSVKKIDDINIILTSQKDDLSEDLKYLLNEDEINNNQKYFTEATSKYGDSKINFIAETFKNEMLKDSDHYIFSIMVIYTIKNPDELKEALEHVRGLQKGEVEK